MTTTPSSDDNNKRKSIMEKFLSPNSKPTMESFPELPDCVVWLRFVMAVCYVTWLVIYPSGLVGGSNILLGLNLVTFVPVLYCQTYLGADQESFGNSLLFAGVIPSAAAIVLIWIYFYTESHSEDVAIFASALSKVMSSPVQIEFDAAGGNVDVSSPVSVGVEDSSVSEESEF